VTPRVRRRGFTLLEALLALVLATLLFGAIALYTGTWLRSWGGIVALGTREDTVAIVLDRIVEDLEATQPIHADGPMTGAVAFSGQADTVVFVRPALGYGPRAGFDQVTYLNGSAGREAAVIRARRAYPPQDGGGEDLPLIRGDARLSLAYAGADGEFTQRWESPDRLPSTVRITLSGMQPRPWTQTAIARLRVELPAACGARDLFQECMSVLNARR